MASVATMLTELPLLVEVVLKAAVVLAVFLVMPLALGQLEHKLMGHMQGRLGPMEAGPHGILQLVADGIKFVQKEDVTPAAADRVIKDVAADHEMGIRATSQIEATLDVMTYDVVCNMMSCTGMC